MTEEQLGLFQAVGDCLTDNLFWNLCYLNNALFHTPLAAEAKQELMGISRKYETILKNVYQSQEADKMVRIADENNRLFCSYVEALIQKDPAQIEAAKQKWMLHQKKMAQLLSEINPYWKQPEWSAMLRHEASLLDRIAQGILTGQYSSFGSTVPLCKRLAIDMSEYLCSGILKDHIDHVQHRPPYAKG